jgi:hypothetical protein
VSAIWYAVYAKDHFHGPGSMDIEGAEIQGTENGALHATNEKIAGTESDSGNVETGKMA